MSTTAGPAPFAHFGYGTDYAKQGTEIRSWFGFEQKVLAMYACGTIIEIDEDAVVTERDW